MCIRDRGRIVSHFRGNAVSILPFLCYTGCILKQRSVPGCRRDVYKRQVELLQKLAAAGYATPVFISDAASVSPSAVLEPGCIILPQAYVGADAHLGVGTIVNAGAIVDHNAQLGRGVHVAPGGIVKAGAQVAEFAKVDSGEVVRSPWEKK